MYNCSIIKLCFIVVYVEGIINIRTLRRLKELSVFVSSVCLPCSSLSATNVNRIMSVVAYTVLLSDVVKRN